MVLRIATILVILALGALVTGVATSSTAAYVTAAVFSGVAVIALWRFVLHATERTFVTEPPPELEPTWSAAAHVERPFEDTLTKTVPEVAIPDYQDLIASEILPSLETLSVEQLEAVIARERAGLDRERIISRAEKLIDLTRSSEVDVREPQPEVLASTTKTARRTTARRKTVTPPDPAAIAKKRTRTRKLPPKDDGLSI